MTTEIETQKAKLLARHESDMRDYIALLNEDFDDFMAASVGTLTSMTSSVHWLICGHYEFTRDAEYTAWIERLRDESIPKLEGGKHATRDSRRAMGFPKLVDAIVLLIAYAESEGIDITFIDDFHAMVGGTVPGKITIERGDPEKLCLMSRGMLDHYLTVDHVKPTYEKRGP